MSAIHEWAEFELKPGVNEQRLLQASTSMQVEFLDHRIGFISRDTIRLGAGRYADLVEWRSHEDAKAAMLSASNTPVCRAYFALMVVPTPPKVGTTVRRHGATRAWNGLEFSRFRPRHGATRHDLALAASEMVQGLYAGRPGFVSHALFTNDDGDYADVLLADTRARAEALCGSWVEDPASATYAPACRRYLSLIEPSSVRLEFWDRVASPPEST